MSRPTKSYLICANQRSGTTMLCRALADTGIAGRPEEYFLAVNETELPDWQCWEKGPFGVANGATDREHYLEIVYRLGTTPNGVFGAKLMFNNVRWVVEKFREMPAFGGLDRAGVFRTAFPDLRVVHLTRRDRLRQAVSWARAAQDELWWVDHDTEPPPTSQDVEYDFGFIRALKGLIEEGEGEQGWRARFAEMGLTPYEIVYEELISDDGYETAIRGVLDDLGLEQPAAVPLPRTRRQAGDLNEEWVQRYLRDEGALPAKRGA